MKILLLAHSTDGTEAIQSAKQQFPSADLEMIDRFPFLPIESSSIDQIKILTSVHFLRREVYTKCLQVLKPNGVMELLNADPNLNVSQELSIIGFTNATQIDEKTLQVQKPNFEVGATFKLQRRPKKLTENKTTANDKEMKLAMLENQANDYIDPESLLDEDDLKKPEVPLASDCATKKKACKNCTCGRLEQELKGDVVLVDTKMDTLPKSSCGSCYLGDAFRCSSCPYLGMPAFKPGEKVTIALDSDL